MKKRAEQQVIAKQPYSIKKYCLAKPAFKPSCINKKLLDCQLLTINC